MPLTRVQQFSSSLYVVLFARSFQNLSFLMSRWIRGNVDAMMEMNMNEMSAQESSGLDRRALGDLAC